MIAAFGSATAIGENAALAANRMIQFFRLALIVSKQIAPPQSLSTKGPMVRLAIRTIMSLIAYY